MSDIATKPEEKPVVETPKVDEAAATVAPVEETTATTVTDAPAVEEAATEETPAEVKAEEEAKEEKPEPKEITHGILSKNHGGLLAFFKQKRFFYFQDDAIPEDKLKSYLHKESHAKSTAAFATQTGKGLLLYSKDESNQVPHGIIKLADVTDVVSVGATKFVLKQGPHGDLHFEAPAPERDSWVFTLKSKIADAKTAAEAITESEEYKAALEKFTRPPVVAAKVAEKPADSAEEAKETETEEAKADSAEKADTEAAPVVEGEAAESKDVKRSASTSKKAKRTSVFTSFFDKKEKAAEEKKDEVKEETEEAKETETPAVAASSTEPATEATEPVKSEEVEEAKPVEAKASEATTPKEATSPKTTKRLSFFGGFNKKKAESAPAVEKTEEDKAETPAPTVTDAPAVVEPTETETEAKPVDAPTETAAAPEKLTASSPPKSSKFNLSSFIKREKSPAPKAEEKATATEAPKIDDVVAPVEETPATTVTDAPLVVEEAPAKETSAEETPAEATSPKETKRKSSFFSGFKAKKSEETKGDEQTSESEAPKAKSGVLGGLIRKASRGGSKPAKEAEKEVAAPATVAEEPETVSAEPVKTETETEAATDAAPAAEPTQSIGDVVPDAVTVGQAPVKASA